MNRQAFAAEEDVELKTLLLKETEGCPNCHKYDNCGCDGCMKRLGPRSGIYKKWDGDFQSCGHCGWTMHYGEWEDREYLRYRVNRSWPDSHRWTMKDLHQEFLTLHKRQKEVGYVRSQEALRLLNN